MGIDVDALHDDDSNGYPRLVMVGNIRLDELTGSSDDVLLHEDAAPSAPEPM